MQDVTSLYENADRESRISETDYELQSKPTTPGIDQRRVLPRQPTFLPNITVNQKNTRRQEKTHKYEAPASDRESWWRVTIKDTPNPGTYDTHLNTFIKEIVARPMTYGFKSDGRRRDPQPLEPKGKDLLPGAYTVEDFAGRMLRLRLTYGFKGPQRQDLLQKSLSANHDKDIDVAPGLYETQNYQNINAPVESAKHSFFKSKTRRKTFLPKIGPAPSDYEPRTKLININSPTITSSFRSCTDRFFKKSMKVPGPGTYDKLTAFPSSKQMDNFATRGVYFNANFADTASAAV